ncbi:acyltransferase family protein [Arthrobacter sp. zg-Y179]|uniref:acyltransferase family protein n=1 Tax=Arthrobacter sp. zg-Y179 TaxID=2894188 RepID=UPI002F405E45|nr:acyltransferase [Arthrobacter sp. zg-Y179]
MTQLDTAYQPGAEQRTATVSATKPGYRPEVQGLRALAVLMVASYHIWLGKVSGGVDVFLLISAFLLSLSFIRKIEGGRALNLGRYWTHVFKRLLPTVAVVLVGTLAATALFVPRSRWSEILSQAWSSLFYFQNWALAENSVDYYATDQSVASPLQHFWSLSVQGQVFILWPLLFALSAVISRTAKLRLRRVVFGVFGTVFAASFAFSVYETYTNQTYAYFDTRARLWEFAFGTLLVLALPYIRLPRPVRIAAGWIGLAAMLSGGFVLDVQGQFPGYVALWPVLAATLVIVAGQTGSAFSADRFLSWKPLIRLGDMSYALYLWHWPVLIIYLIWRGRDEVGPVGGTAIVAVSILLAYLTTRFVERPLRSIAWAERKKRRAGVIIAICITLVAVPVAAWQGALKHEAAVLAADAERNNPGAAALLPGYVDQSDEGAQVLPLPEQASTQWPDVPAACDSNDAMEVVCDVLPRTEGAAEAVIVGSSHAQMWVSALGDIAAERDWNLGMRVKGGCPLTFEGGTDDCLDFNARTMELLLESPPDLVITNGSRTVLDGEEYVEDSWVQAVSELLDAGTAVVAVRDSPRFAYDVPTCVADSPDAGSCGLEAARILGPGNPAETALTHDRLVHLDFSDYLCPDGFCPAVIGNVVVYMDHDHLTRTFVETLAPIVDQRLSSALSEAAINMPAGQ